MNAKTQLLYEKAMETKYKLTHGLITTDQAVEDLKEYGKLFNESARAISKEFGTTPKKFDAIAFLR